MQVIVENEKTIDYNNWKELIWLVWMIAKALFTFRFKAKSYLG